MEPQKDLEPLWTPVQVAKFLGVHKQTVYRWLSTGTVLDSTKLVRFNRRVRIPRSEVVRLAGTVRDNLN